MTEAAILRMMIDGAVILAAACLFVRFLCDEYIRALELYGLIRPRRADDPDVSGRAEDAMDKSSGARR